MIELNLDTFIHTTTGLVSLKNLNTDSFVVDERGNAIDIKYLSDVNEKECFRVTFDDASSFVCSIDHELNVMSHNDRKNSVRRTEEHRIKYQSTRKRMTGKRLPFKGIYKEPQQHQLKPVSHLVLSVEHLTNARQARNYSLPPKQIMHLGFNKTLELPPYTLGAWLGDGTSIQPNITSADIDIIKEIEKDGFQCIEIPSAKKGKANLYRIAYYQNIPGVIGHDGVASIKHNLRNMNIYGNKHIPEEYFLAAFQERLSLLQGLMDTDGTISKQGRCEFSVVNKRLAEDTYILLLTFGIKSRFREGPAKLNGRVVGTRYRIVFTTTLPVFRLPRKLIRLPSDVQERYSIRYIDSIEPIGVQSVRQIVLENRSMMIGKDYISI